MWIDIFPIDNVPDKGKKAFYFKILNIYRRAYNYKRYESNGWKIDVEENMIKDCLRKLYITKYKRKSLREVIETYINQCKKYKSISTKNVNSVVWGIGEAEEFPRFLFDNIIEYDFENIKVKGIKDFDMWLRKRYGNYMELPPVEQRVCHDIIAWRKNYEE